MKQSKFNFYPFSGLFNFLGKNKNYTRLLLSAVLVFITITGNATIYYVSTSGNDSNSGTSEGSPWKSLSKVNSFSFKAGDQILFKRGEHWTGTITVNASGTSGSPIVYGAYGTGEKPKIYGSETITNWTKHSGNVYKASVSKPVNQVFVNNEKVQVARYPNTGYFKVTSVQSSTRFTSSELSSGIDYKGASWFGRTGYYFNPTHNVVSSSSNSITLDAAPQKDLNEGEGFFLMNKLAFIDQPGEWAYDPSSKTVYLWLPGSDSPENYTVKGSTYERGLYGSGKNYITVQGLEFLHQAEKGIEIYNGSNWVIDNNNFLYPDAYAVIDERYGENHTVSNNKVVGANHIGFQLRTNNSEVTDNELTKIGTMENLGISGNGRYYYGSAMFVAGKGNVVRYNRVTEVNYNGIYFAGPNNLIEYNFIENTCLMKGDGGGIYTTQPGTNPTTGSVVRHNIIINTEGSNQGYTSRVQFGEGIYIDESAHGVTVEHNTVYKSANAGIKLHKTDANIVRHNTIIDSRMAIQVLNSSGSTKTKIHDNIMWSTGNGDVNNYEPRQLMIRVSSPNAEINNNTYRNPYESSGIFRGSSYMSFDEWKSKMGYDKNSTSNFSKLSSGEKEQLFYNDTKKDKTVNLGNKVYKDIDGKQVTGSFTLKPYTSRILVGTDLQVSEEGNKTPEIQDQYFEVTAPKNLNDFLAQIVANDPDAGQELSYTILEGNEDGLLALSSSSGKIYAKKDIRTATDITVTLVVEVKDNAVNFKSATATITVVLKSGTSNQTGDDEEDNPPVYTDVDDINDTTGLANSFSIYPNPAQTFINVEYASQPEGHTLIEILGSGGRVLFSQEVSSILNRIDFDRLRPGLYYLRSTNSKSEQVQKFVVR